MTGKNLELTITNKREPSLDSSLRVFLSLAGEPVFSDNKRAMENYQIKYSKTKWDLLQILSPLQISQLYIPSESVQSLLLPYPVLNHQE